jgi:hypothetical protein
MRQYKSLALFVLILFLPVVLIGIAKATKTAKPEYVLHSDLEVVAGEHAVRPMGIPRVQLK